MKIIMMLTKAFLIFSLFLFVFGCGGKEKEGESVKLAVPPTEIIYEQLPKEENNPVIFKCFIFGEGNSFKRGEKMYFVLCPETDFDWLKIFELSDEAVAMKQEAAMFPDAYSGGVVVQRYERLKRETEELRGTIQAIESDPNSLAWGEFSDNIIGYEYNFIPVPAALLINPKNKELEEELDKIIMKLERMKKSGEFEITGRVLSTNSKDAPDSSKDKEFYVVVDSYKLLRSAEQLAEESRVKKRSIAPEQPRID